jgi:hypothetical protein
MSEPFQPPKGATYKIISSMLLTDDQRKEIEKVSGQACKSLEVVELSLEDSKRLSPALIRPATVLMCW